MPVAWPSCFEKIPINGPLHSRTNLAGDMLVLALVRAHDIVRLRVLRRLL
jgi:hypothetical protein